MPEHWGAEEAAVWAEGARRGAALIFYIGGLREARRADPRLDAVARVLERHPNLHVAATRKERGCPLTYQARVVK